MTTHSKDIREQLADILEMYKNYVVRNSTNKFALTQEQAIEDIESLIIQARIDELGRIFDGFGNKKVYQVSSVEILDLISDRIAQLTKDGEK